MSLQQGTADSFNSLDVRIPGKFAPIPVNRAPEAIRQLMYATPAAQGAYDPEQNCVTIDMPSSGIMDLSRGYLMFNAAFTKDAPGTYVRCHNGVWTSIDRIVVSSNGIPIEEARHYGDWMHLLYLMTREVNMDSYTPFSLCGIGSDVSRNGWAAGKQYAIPIILGFCTVAVLDLGELKGGLQWQIYFRAPKDFMECDSALAVLSYSITNPMFHWEALTFKNSSTKNTAVLPNHVFRCITWSKYNFQHTSNAIQFNLQHRSNAVDALITVSNNLADLSNVTVNNRLETYRFNTMTDYQAVLNGSYYPPRPVVVGPAPNNVMGYIEFLKNCGKWTIQGVWQDPTPITMDDWINNKYIQIIDLRAFPSSPQLVNPVAFVGGTAQIQMNMNMSAVPAAQQQLSTYVIYEYLLELKDGIFYITK